MSGLRSSRSEGRPAGTSGDRKSTRLNSSHMSISYAVFCLKKKTKTIAYRNATNNNKTNHILSNNSYLQSKVRRTNVASTKYLLFVLNQRLLLSDCCFFFLRIRQPPRSTLFPYTPLF